MNKTALKDAAFCSRVVATYLDGRLLTAQQVAKLHSIGFHTVLAILQQELSEETRRQEYSKRLSLTKLGERNPMKGVSGEAHPSWKGICSDKKGHFTILRDGKRYFVHRLAIADYFGIPIEKLSANIIVHHIDGNPANNDIDNLAITTRSGHTRLEQRQRALFAQGQELSALQSSLQE